MARLLQNYFVGRITPWQELKIYNQNLPCLPSHQSRLRHTMHSKNCEGSMDELYAITKLHICMEVSLIIGKFPIHPKPLEVFAVQTEQIVYKRGNNNLPNGQNKNNLVFQTNHCVHHVLPLTGGRCQKMDFGDPKVYAIKEMEDKPFCGFTKIIITKLMAVEPNVTTLIAR